MTVSEEETWMTPIQRDEDLGGSAPMDQAQPLRMKTRSMPQDIGPDQDSPTITSAPSLPQRITRSKEQTLGAEH